MWGPGYGNLGGDIGGSPLCDWLFIKMVGWEMVMWGHSGAEYAAKGNECPRQQPKRVTNHPACPNPASKDVMDQWSQYVMAEMYRFTQLGWMEEEVDKQMNEKKERL